MDDLADRIDGRRRRCVRPVDGTERPRAEELARRGALDFGEQIAAVTQLFKVRPNLLRRWQRQFAYILIDEFQDVNIAQIELVELLGRTPDRPDNVMVVGDDDQSIYRFRGASFAAFSEFDRRFSRPPAHDRDGPAPGPPPRTAEFPCPPYPLDVESSPLHAPSASATARPARHPRASRPRPRTPRPPRFLLRRRRSWDRAIPARG